MDQATHNKIASFIWGIADDVLRDLFKRGKYPGATQWFKPLRKNLGKKNCELAPDDIERVCDTYLKFEETPQSKIFPNAAFGYWKVTVERPLRLHSQLSVKTMESLRFASGDQDLRSVLYDKLGVRLSASDLKTILRTVSWRVETAPPVIAKVHKPGKGGRAVAVQADPLRGLYPLAPSDGERVEVRGKPGAVYSLAPSDGERVGVRGKPEVIVEYEPDPDLRDTEQVPLLEPGGIEAFLRREVLPYTPDAWIKQDATKIGYEISFTRHFYQPQPLRTLEEIRADILAVQPEAEGLIDELLKGEPR